MHLPQNTRTRISVAARIKTRLGKIEEDYVDEKKDRGRGTAIGVVQDQLSPLLWVALHTSTLCANAPIKAHLMSFEFLNGQNRRSSVSARTRTDQN